MDDKDDKDSVVIPISTKGKHGGARKGAGRPPGAATKRSEKIANRLAQECKKTPLEHMLDVLNEDPADLRKQFTNEEITEAEYLLLLKDMIQRKDWAAQQAAPYIHPRLASIERNDGKDRHEDFLDDLEDDEKAAAE